MAQFWGWRERDKSDGIFFDPGLGAQCPHCRKSLGKKRPVDLCVFESLNGKLDLFYRYHVDCRQKATQQELADIDSKVLYAPSRAFMPAS